MKKFLILFFAFFIAINIQSQTIISGGIYTNTTWTASNSPYIVIDTLVVFPGVTLTIEPGVTVKFDNGIGMEIRQAYLIANGTASDSITFTSNSTTIPGSWKGVRADTNSIIKYCNFSYAEEGVSFCNHVTNTTFTYNEIGARICNVDSSIFKNNITGSYSSSLDYCKLSLNQTAISYVGSINNCVVDSNVTGINLYAGTVSNCLVSHNQNGISVELDGNIMNTTVDGNVLSGIKVERGVDSVVDCIIINNGGAGIESYAGSDILKITGCLIAYNDIGAIIHSNFDSLYCNEICNNNLYDLKYVGNANYTLPGNYWCTTDSSILSDHIFDGYDDVTYGLVAYFPVDTNGCNLHLTLETPSIEVEDAGFTIYPNPSRSFFKIKNLKNNKYENLQLYNSAGQMVLNFPLKNVNDDQAIETHLLPGVYSVYIFSDTKFICNKLVIN